MGYYANEALLRFLYKAGKKWNWLWPLLAGALSFGISQLLLRIPILQYGLPRFDWFLLLPYRNPLLYGWRLQRVCLRRRPGGSAFGFLDQTGAASGTAWYSDSDMAAWRRFGFSG